MKCTRVLDNFSLYGVKVFVDEDIGMLSVDNLQSVEHSKISQILEIT